MLTEIAVEAAPNDKSPLEKVVIEAATADYTQSGFPVENAFDQNDKTGWAIDNPSARHQPHTATFRLAPASSGSQRNRWVIRLEQKYGGHHTIGRFRVQLGERIADDRPENARRADHLNKKFAAWQENEASRATRWTQLTPITAASDVPTLQILPDGSIYASGDQTKRDVYRLSFANKLPRVTALRLEALPDDRLPKNGPGRIAYEGPFGDFFLSEVTVRAVGEERALRDASQSFNAGKDTAARAIDHDPQTGWSISGGQGRAHSAVFTLADPISGADAIDIDLLFEKYYAAGLGRFRIWATDDDRPLTASALPTDVETLLLVPADQRTPEARERLLTHYLSVAPELAGERDKIAKLRESLPAFPSTLVMMERPAENPRRTFIHKRGEFLQPTAEVDGELPSLFAPLPADVRHDRLALARWLASDKNPLVGRVTVNRHWAALFGRGLVRTTEDFGYQGEPPTHPELLDWLAVEFMRDGWSTKRLHKLIVTSATYRQSSRASGELLERDPQNRLLARAPRVRLDAELVRDVVLSASGLLSEKIGGPSVFPPQPPNVSSEGAYGPLDWKTSEGADRYRRGLYTFSKRTAPYAMFTAFDAPSGEACLARREVSNTPLQSLTLLNDSVFLEAAQALGQKITAEQAASHVAVDARVSELFRRFVSRPPTPGEQRLLAQFFTTHRERLVRGELDAAAIAGPGEADPVERAAWTLTARAIMNIDEAITKE